LHHAGLILKLSLRQALTLAAIVMAAIKASVM
jgi:hypothetical protein